MVRTLAQIEKYAEENHIPIMQRDGIEYLLSYIKEHHCKRILEIGTAIGYSAIRMALLDKDIKIVTIERDIERYKEAIQNIEKCTVSNQVEAICADALEIEVDGLYDLIFIDAAKAQYIKFFEKFKKNLVSGGTIVSDNLSFHGLVEQENSNVSRNVRGLIRKIRLYIAFLKENEEFQTTFLAVGDGIGISTRK